MTALLAAAAACVASGAALVALGVPADAVALLTLPFGGLAAAAVMEAEK
jgi:hypothetical protein